MKYLLTLSMLCILGCGNPYPIKTDGYEFKVIEIDGCEYLVSGGGNSQKISHKGNCKYCLRRSNAIKYGYLDSVTLHGSSICYWYDLNDTLRK